MVAEIWTSDMLVGFGDPLLDITANVDDTFLDKFKLKPNDCVMAGPLQNNLQQELVRKYPSVTYTAGGATANTLRAFQWIVRKPLVATMIGAIGNDQFGRDFESECAKCGVKSSLQYHDTEPTGTCCVLLTANGAKRSLVTNKGAAGCFSIDHLRKPETQGVLRAAKCIYASCFFLMGNLDGVLLVAEQAKRLGQTFCLNLSAPFIMHLHADKVKQILPFVDIVFCNDSEAEAFAHHIIGVPKASLYGQDLAKKLAETLKPGARVVMTQGEDPVISAKVDTVQIFVVPQLSKDKVRDTNGAGDAFVAGYLASYLAGMPEKVCLQNGVIAGGEVVQRLGCTFPARTSVVFNGL